MLLFFLAQTFTMHGQYENLVFNQLDERDGLSSNNVNCIIQDKEGFIWAGTDNGLNRFDGYNFKHYMHNPEDSASLIHDHILNFYISGSGDLWIGTHYGMCRYDPRKDRFRQFRRGYRTGHVRGFYEDEKGQLFLVNDVSEVYMVLEDRVQLVADYEDHNYSYLYDKDGHHWFGMQRGVKYIDPETHETRFYDLSSVRSDVDEDVTVFTLLEDGNRIWMGTRSDGIFYFDKATGTVSAFDIRLAFIKTLQKDAEGNLLIGDTDGLKIYYTKTGKMQIYNPLVDKSEQHITANATDAIYKDRQGNLWLGIKFRGLNVAYVDKGFRHIEYQSADPYDRTKKTIISVVAETDNVVWVGSYTNGIEKVDLLKKTSEYYPCSREFDGLKCGSVYELYRDTDSVLWIGTYEGGLQRMDPIRREIENYFPGASNETPLDAIDIRSLARDSKGNYWLLAHGTGVYKWNPATDSLLLFRNIPNDTASLCSNWAFHLICDSKDQIWIATAYGLSVCRDGKTIHNYRNDASDPNSLISDEVFTVFEDSRGTMWIGTREGLCKYDPEHDSFITVTRKQGLVDNFICSILEDRHDNLWIATKKGLSRYNTQTGSVKNYTTGDGLQNNEFMENAAALTPSGYMIFASVNRGTWFHPDSLIENKEPPQIYFTDLKLFNRSVSVEPHNEDAILRSPIRYAKEIQLDHKQKVISFSFVALNYIHPEKNKFAYKLENFDQAWIYTEDIHEVTYTNLTPGDYVFRVKACNNDGYWNEEGISLKVVILPPFWKTWWFRILAGLFVVLLLLLIFFLRVRNIRKANLNLERTVVERTHELQAKNQILAKQTEELNYSNRLIEQRQQQIIEQSKELKQKNKQLNLNSDELREQKEKLEATNRKLRELNAMKDRFFSIIGHDLRNPINVIRGFVELLEEGHKTLDDERKLNYLSHISKTIDKTSQLLDNLLHWAKSQSGSLNTNPENLNIHLLVQNALSLFREESGKKNIQFKTDLDDRHMLAYADKNMVETIIRNLISNAIKFSPRDSDIEIGCEHHEDSDHLLIWVKDNGLGISAQDMQGLFQPETNISTTGTEGETGTGLGLILCKEFVEKNKGRIWADSKPGEGSVFYFTLQEVQT